MSEEEVTKRKKPRPLLDDLYWFEVAKEMVDKAPERLNESAERFEKLILWLWGIYTPIIGLGTVGFSLLPKVTFTNGVLTFLLSPCVILLVAYFFATKAKSSERAGFKQGNIGEIKKAYFLSLKTKRKWYTISQFTALLACVMIPFAIGLANWNEKKEEYLFEAKVKQEMGETLQVTVSSKLTDVKNVKVIIGTAKYDYALYDGILHTSFKITKEEFEKNPEITIEWIESTSPDEVHKKSISKKLKLVE